MSLLPSPILFLTHLNNNIHLRAATHLGTEAWHSINQNIPFLGTSIWSLPKKKPKTRYRIYQCGDRLVKVRMDDQDESDGKKKKEEGKGEEKSIKGKKAKRKNKKKNRSEEDDRKGMEKDKKEGSWFGGLGIRFGRGFARGKRNLVEGSGS
jgi:hypothetical protein